MASGESVVEALRIVPPTTLYATADQRVGGSTPAEAVPVYDFDQTTVEYLDVYARLGPNYAGGGLTLRLPFSMTTATTGTVTWGAAIRRIASDAEDVDTSQTYDYNDSSATTVPSASGEVVDATITFTSGSDMDSLAAGELFVLRVRHTSQATATGDAELWADAISIRET